MRPAVVVALPLAFAAFGAVWGAWQAVLPDLARHSGLSTGPLGAILTLGFAVSLPAMLATGRLVDRIGSGRGIAVPALVMAAGLLLAASLPPIGALVAAVVLLLAGSGGYDVAINGAAMGDRGWSRPARLTLLHAAFSGGGAAGAIAAGMAIGGGTPFAAVYLALAIALVAVAVVTLAARWGSASPVDRVPRSVALLMLPLAALAGVAFLAEGSIETWSAIYLRDELGAAAVVGALGPAAFHAAMLVGRLFGAAIVGWLGSSATLLVAGIMGIAGMSVALLAGAAQVAIPAMGVAALGASFVVPVVVSLAARRSAGYAGHAASYVLTLGYAGFLIGPSLVGIGGELFGLRVALVVVPAAAALVAIASRTSVARE